MNIFYMTETQSGCYKWRGAIPAKYLRQRGHTVQIFSDQPRDYEAPDVMVFFRAHYPSAMKIVEWCKQKNIRVVFDTDDALDLVPPENLNYKILQPRLPVYEALLRAADLVTTTTPNLASHLRKWNRNIAILPNSVDPDEWSPRPRASELRVGWSGSPTHFADLGVVLDAVRELQRRYPFTFVLQGLCQEASLEELRAVLDATWGNALFKTPLGKAIAYFLDKMKDIQHEFHPAVPVDRHAETVCDLRLDVGLAPLTDTRFNHNKSCIKFYEYAMSGAATVASHVLPYSLEVPTTAKNNREAWKRALEPLLAGDCVTPAREQREWVLQHRNMQKNAELWERAYAGDASLTIPSFQQAGVYAEVK